MKRKTVSVKGVDVCVETCKAGYRIASLQGAWLMVHCNGKFAGSNVKGHSVIYAYLNAALSAI